MMSPSCSLPAPRKPKCRPIVAAMAIGVGRAALDFVRDFLKQQNVPIRYGVSPRRLTAIERDFMEMEVQLKAARLLTWRAAWMLDQGKHNNLEASMAKAKAGLAVTQITQKAVELLGPLGYSRANLVETLAEHCVAIIREEFAVSWVRLKLSKPGAVRGARAVGVRIERGTRPQ